ncbi:MAG TPA: phosphopantetheine-binding protein [Burkholderiales bacterium]|nr:phosphopantetheine-binding protein [Burkholderiales bacterium]
MERLLPQTHLEHEVAALIVDAVNLDCAPDEIEPEAPLFGEGLGLDSIDLLEVALAISQKYGFKLRSDDENNKVTFSCLRALSGYVEKHRTR